MVWLIVINYYVNTICYPVEFIDFTMMWMNSYFSSNSNPNFIHEHSDFLSVINNISYMLLATCQWWQKLF